MLTEQPPKMETTPKNPLPVVTVRYCVIAMTTAARLRRNPHMNQFSNCEDTFLYPS